MFLLASHLPLSYLNLEGDRSIGRMLSQCANTLAQLILGTMPIAPLGLHRSHGELSASRPTICTPIDQLLGL